MRTVRALVLLALLPGCDALRLSPDGASPQLTADVLPDATTDSANVSGYAWDPESFFFALASGGGALPPVTVAGVPTLERSLVGAVSVALVDPPTGQELGRVPATSGEGTWELLGVSAREAPMEIVASPADGATPVLRSVGPPSVPMIPEGNYVSTVSLMEISTRSHLCAAVKAPVLSDDGILQAVANHLSAAGSSTVVGDLLDPTRFGGVAVLWLYAPGGPNVRAPAATTTVTASAGTVLSIAWAPPGAGPPDQSARGFFVVDAPVSPIGVSVLVLPAGTNEPVQLAAVDPSVTAPRPWSFPALPPVNLVPGTVSFGELPAITPGSVAPPEWACLPE